MSRIIKALSHLGRNVQRHGQEQSSLRGDTLIEVTFAIGVFSIVSVIAINLMNSGLQTAQANLEITMARNEIDAQADALRFIQNSYAADRSYITNEQHYRDLWHYLAGGGGHGITGLAYEPDNSSIGGFNTLSDSTGEDICKQSFYGGSETLKYTNAFVINTRNLNPEQYNETVVANKGANAKKFKPATLYPRIIYGTNDDTQNLYESSASNAMQLAEGIWVLSIKDQTRGSDAPEFYDFHIRTCWYAPGANYPTTIATVIRLYNPDAVEGDFR